MKNKFLRTVVLCSACAMIFGNVMSVYAEENPIVVNEEKVKKDFLILSSKSDEIRSVYRIIGL